MSPSSVQQRAGGRGPPAAPCGGRQKQHSGCGRPPGGPAGSTNAHAAELARRRPSVARPPLPPHCSAAADPARPRASPRRSGLWALKKKNGGKFPVHPKQEKAAAEASKKPAKFYAAGPTRCCCRTCCPACAECARLGMLGCSHASCCLGHWRKWLAAGGA